MNILSHFSEFVPKSWICFREGYNKSLFWHDLFAGASVGVIALPLALAFAIASGVTPERGLYTAIIAGFLISLLGGSRVQIGGPTGAFVVIVYGVIQRHGYQGLAEATIIAAILMVLMGIARFGILLKFIPYSVTTGFTTGIAVVIFTTQLKDFFGLDLKNIPPDFLEKCKGLCLYAHTWNPYALSIAIATLITIFLLRHYYPKVPGVILAIIGATAITFLFQLPIETIESRFGEIPRTLPRPCMPSFSWERIQLLFPDAITIALLGAIESLLSAVVADGLSGHRHRSNCELVAQGIANFGSIVFGGIPATGAIARTTANIRLGAKTPVSGMIHAITLLLLMLFFAPLAAKIPLSSLAAVLVFIAYNMSEIPHFYSILRGPIGDAIILSLTFLLTVLIDLTVAVQVGVVLSAFLFIRRMTKATTYEIVQTLQEEKVDKQDEEILFRNDIPDDVIVFEIKGPFFYSVADMLTDALAQLPFTPRVFIVRMKHVPLIDVTGLHALKKFAAQCRSKKILLLISGLQPDVLELCKKESVEKTIGKEHIFPNINSALGYAKKSAT